MVCLEHSFNINHMKTELKLLLSITIAFVVVGCVAPGPQSDKSVSKPLSEVHLNMPSTKATPGGILQGKLLFKLASGWHTYGDPPGDSGMPPLIKFSLSPGWHAKLMPLPPAMRFEDAAGVTFGYEEELTIRFQLKAPGNAEVGSTADVKINVQWLICKDVCKPMSDILPISLTIVTSPK